MSGFDSIAKLIPKPLPETQDALENEQRYTKVLLKKVQEKADNAKDYELGKACAERLKKLSEKLAELTKQSQQAQIHLAEAAKAEFEKKLSSHSFTDWVKENPASAVMIGTGILSLASSLVLDENNWFRKTLRTVRNTLGLGFLGYGLWNTYQDYKDSKAPAPKSEKAEPEKADKPAATIPAAVSSIPPAPAPEAAAVSPEKKAIDALEQAKKEADEKARKADDVLQPLYEDDSASSAPEDRAVLRDAIQAQEEVLKKIPNETPEVKEKYAKRIARAAPFAADPDNKSMLEEYGEKILNYLQTGFTVLSGLATERWIISKFFEVFYERGRLTNKPLLAAMRDGNLSGAAKLIEQSLKIEHWSLLGPCQKLLGLRAEIEKGNKAYLDLVRKIGEAEGLLENVGDLPQVEEKVLKKAEEILGLEKDRKGLAGWWKGKHAQQPACEKLLAMKKVRDAKFLEEEAIFRILRQGGLAPSGTPEELVNAAEEIVEKFKPRGMIGRFFAGENRLLMRGGLLDARFSPALREVTEGKEGVGRVFQALEESRAGAKSAKRILAEPGRLRKGAAFLRMKFGYQSTDMKLFFELVDKNADQVVRLIKIHGSGVVEALSKVSMTEGEFSHVLTALEKVHAGKISSWSKQIQDILAFVRAAPKNPEILRIYQILTGSLPEEIGLSEMNTLVKIAEDESEALQLGRILRAAKVEESAIEKFIIALKTRNVSVIGEVIKESKIVRLKNGMWKLLAWTKYAPKALSYGLRYGVPAVAGIVSALSELNVEGDNEGLKAVGVEKAEIAASTGLFFTVEGPIASQIDKAVLARYGASSRLLNIGSKVALPLAILVSGLEYMTTTALDATKEHVMQRDDYLIMAMKPKEGHEELIHQWFTTGDDLALSDRLHSTYLGPEKNYYEWQKTRTKTKIIDALIFFESSGESEEYRQYRMKFIEAYTNGSFNISNLEEGRTLLAKSKIFADMMSDRGGMGFRDKKFDPQLISKEEVRNIFFGAEAVNSQKLEDFFSFHFKENGEKLFSRIRHLDTNYLNYALSIIHRYQALKTDNTDTQENKTWVQFENVVSEYLKFKGLKQEKICNETPEKVKSEMENFKNVFFDPAENYESLKGEFEPKSAAINGIYELAKFFGYQSSPDFSSLQNFFTPDHASRHGIYWNGEQWKVNIVGGFDRSCGGREKTGEAVLSMLKVFKNHPDDIFPSRYDYVLDVKGRRDDEEKRAEQVKTMISIMSKAVFGNKQGISE